VRCWKRRWRRDVRSRRARRHGRNRAGGAALRPRATAPCPARAGTTRKKKSARGPRGPRAIPARRCRARTPRGSRGGALVGDNAGGRRWHREELNRPTSPHRGDARGSNPRASRGPGPGRRDRASSAWVVPVRDAAETSPPSARALTSQEHRGDLGGSVISDNDLSRAGSVEGPPRAGWTPASARLVRAKADGAPATPPRRRGDARGDLPRLSGRRDVADRAGSGRWPPPRARRRGGRRRRIPRDQ